MDSKEVVPRGPSARGIWWLLALSVLSVVGLAGTTIALAVSDEGDGLRSDITVESEPDVTSESESENDLDLYNSCDSGDMASCDALYTESPVGSSDEEFGSTCGDTSAPTEGNCTDQEFDSEPFSYGDDPDLDALYDDCEEGDMGACDDLYMQSASGSDYEEFGETCGYREDALSAGACE